MPKKDVKFWGKELEQAAKHEKNWRVRAQQVIDTYRDDRDSQHGPTKFNILWANTQTQRPALYSSTPKPVVRRRHRQEGKLGRDVAEILERSLVYALDPGSDYEFDRVAEKTILDYLLPGRMVARVKYHPTFIQSEAEAEEGDEETANLLT